MIVQGRNVNHTYTKSIGTVLEFGVQEDSRNGPVLVAPHPVMTVTDCPTERVLFCPNRDANPFFHFFECLWMMSGSNDGKWLDRFVGDFSSRYGEEDGTIHGAYGARWRKWPCMYNRDGLWWQRTGEDSFFDQLTTAVELLRADPKDRRVVVSMWDPNMDLAEEVRDVPCLAGETVVWSPEGDFPIEELARRFETGETSRWPVFAVDPDGWTVKIDWCTSVWKSGTKKTVKITFDDGSCLRVTHDHTLYKRGVRVDSSHPTNAGDLRPGDRVLATRLFTAGKGYTAFKRKLGENTHWGNMIAVHRDYDALLRGPMPDGMEIHHENDDKKDNREQNLVRMYAGAHSTHHMSGDRNPMRRMTREQHRDRAMKHSESLRESWRLRKEMDTHVDNHRVVSVEEDDTVDVYDFTVPEGHNALVGTGVVVHNCNTHMYPRIREEKGCPVLDLTVCCRSNDIIWGATGANAVHFSFVQEWMAAQIGVGVGRMYQLSNNWHAYENTLERVGEPQLVDLYASGKVSPYPICQVPDAWDVDLSRFMERPDSDTRIYSNSFFAEVAVPMWGVHECWKTGYRDLATKQVGAIAATDWREAARAWMQRRIDRAQR